jgi:fatty acid desaturase
MTSSLGHDTAPSATDAQHWTRILVNYGKPIMLLAATAGVWLFYVQHQFEYLTWERKDRWNQHQAALYGSSYYDLPALLR